MGRTNVLRRGNDVGTTEPPKKKAKVVIEELPSMEVSFCDDEALPSGIIFTDVQQQRWRMGKPIGRGSFGRIYLASDEVDKEVTKANARYVVKIEPHTNGPLFVEIHCLIRTAQVSNVKVWRQQKKLKHFGMPVYIANGSFIEKSSGEKYRFLVLPRYDIDLQKVIARTRVLDPKNVLVLAIQILDVLEYLHSQGYTHSDIKSSNLMLGFDGDRYKTHSSPKSPSYQKEGKEVTMLAGKHRKVKTSKCRTSNYYKDDDFTVKEHNGLNPAEENIKLKNVKNKLRKLLTDRENRTLHRHHAFNLRQLSNSVNYEDMTSSVCSDQSYQKLVEYESKCQGYSSDEGFHGDPKLLKNQTKTDIFKEAVLSQSNGQIYLCDYGLASKFLDADGNHKDFAMDARKAHDGTLEYSSRDSHIGAHSRRSDLETLAYNLLDWLTGTLPWKTAEVLAEPDLVHVLKKNFMSNVKTLLKTCFKTEFYPQYLEKYLQYITNLDFTEKPDYDYCRNIFKRELAKIGCLDKELSLKFPEMPCKIACKRLGSKTSQDYRSGVKQTNRENIYSLENDLKLELLRQTLNSSSDGVRKPCASRNFFISDADLVARLKKSLMPHDLVGKKLSPKNLRSKRKVIKKKTRRTHRSSIGKFGNFMGSARQFTWAEILAGNPEDIIRKERNNVSDDDEDTCKYRIRKLSDASDCSAEISPLMQKDYLQGMNPTYAMKEVIANLKKKASNRVTKDEDTIDGPEGYTPAMIKIYKIKERREAKEALDAAKKKTESANQFKVPRTTRSKANVSKGKDGSKDDAEKVDLKKSVKVCKSKTKPVKKEVSFDEKTSTEAKSEDLPKKRTREVTVPTNRRRLRSSRRQRT